MRVAVLGLVQLLHGGHSVALTRSERTLLAGIAVHGDRPASASALAEWIWADGFHASPRNRVQGLVSGVRRKAGPAPVVLTEHGGYRLAPQVGCDLADWQRLRSQAAAADDPAVRATRIREAVGLFSGTPFDGCHDSPAVALQRRHLEEQHLEALGERIDTDIAAGHIDGLISELTLLAEAHPFHETFTAQLMHLLALGGRQAEALEVYRAAYRRLDEELGVRPGPRLEQTHTRVLRGEPGTPTTPGAPTATGPRPTTYADDSKPATPQEAGPAPRLTAPSPRTVPRSVAELVGRDTELRQILDEAGGERSRPAVVSITGLGGVGKSSLAIEAAHRLRDRFPDGSLYLRLDSETGRKGVQSVLELFLGLLGVGTESIPPGPDARSAMFRSVLDERRVLVVLDGIPDGFDPSDLLPARPTSMAILTSRRPVRGAEPTLPVRLKTLDADASVALLGSVLTPERAAADADDLQALARICGGLPLLLRLLGQRLALRPDLRPGQAAATLAEDIAEEGERDDGDRTLRASLGFAEAPLPEATRTVLHEVAALPFPKLSRWVYAALAGSPAVGDRALDQLVDASFVDPVLHEGCDPQYQLHDLVRRYACRAAAQVRTSFSASTSVAAVAERFLDLTTSHAAAFPGQLLPLPLDREGVSPEPGGTATQPSAEDALRFFRTEHHNLLVCARQAAPAHPDVAWRLLALTGNYAQGALEPGLWVSVADEVRRALTHPGQDRDRGLAHLDLVESLLRHEAADSAASVPLATRARRAMLLHRDLPGALAAAVVLGRAHRARGERAEAEEALGWATRSCVDDTPATTVGYVHLAWGSLLDDYDALRPARDHLQRALACFEGTQDWSGTATSQFALARVQRRLGEYAAGLLLADAAIEGFTRLGDDNGHTAALDTRADLLVFMGEPQQARPDAELAVRRAAQRRDTFMLHRAQRTLGRALAGLGQLSAAEQALGESAAGFDALDRPLSLAATLRDTGRILQLQGRVLDARQVFLRERSCLVRAGVDDLTEIDELIARLDARSSGGRSATG